MGLDIRMLQDLVASCTAAHEVQTIELDAGNWAVAHGCGSQVLLTLALSGPRPVGPEELLRRRGHELDVYAHWLPALLRDDALVVVRRLDRARLNAGEEVSQDELEAVKRLFC